MPRYFFVVTYADHQIDDPDGTLLPADTGAIGYARRIINDLREERRPERARSFIVFPPIDKSDHRSPGVCGLLIVECAQAFIALVWNHSFRETSKYAHSPSPAFL